MGIKQQEPIYLEPRRVFDAALIVSDEPIYSVALLLVVLQEFYEIEDFDEVIELFCHDIEPLVHYGLKLEYDSDEI